MSPNTTPQKRHVIFGTGPVGLSIMDHLLAKQQSVCLVNRSGEIQAPRQFSSQVEVVAGDASDPAFAQAVARGADVVYNALNPPYHRWPELFPALQHSVLAAAAAAEAKLIIMENMYMYGRTHGKPMTETTPYTAHTRKGQTRAEMTKDAMAAHRAGKVRVAIARASDFFGPRVRVSAMGEQAFQAALRGQAMQLIGDPDQRHTYTYIHDIGAALVLLGEQEAALGKVWHVPNAETLTTRQFANQIFKQAGTEPSYQVASKRMLQFLGLFKKNVGELVEMLYEFEEPFVVNSNKFSDTFGLTATPLPEAIDKTLAWYRLQA